MEKRRPIRLLHVINGLQLGGAEMTLWRLLSRIDRGRYDVEVVSLSDHGPVSALLSEIGVPTYALGMRLSAPNPRAFLRLGHLIKRFQPDVVQTWLYHADLLGGIAAATAGVPVIWNLRQGNLSWQGNKFTTLATAAACALVSRWLPRRIVCCSQAARLAHERLGYASQKLVVIPNGYDLNRFRPSKTARAKIRAELGVPSSTRLVGLAARFHAQKDHRNFLEACRRISSDDVRFVLCGNGVDPLQPDVSGLVARAGISDRCYLLGPRFDMPDVMAALDVSVSSSFGEGFPNVVAEAMACGVPCVATDVGDSAIIVGDTGKIVPARDPEALAQAMAQLLSMSPQAREQLGLAARERIADRYHLASIVGRYQQLYEEILATQGWTTYAHPETGQHDQAGVLRYATSSVGSGVPGTKDIDNEFARTAP